MRTPSCAALPYANAELPGPSPCERRVARTVIVFNPQNTAVDEWGQLAGPAGEPCLGAGYDQTRRGLSPALARVMTRLGAGCDQTRRYDQTWRRTARASGSIVRRRARVSSRK